MVSDIASATLGIAAKTTQANSSKGMTIINIFFRIASPLFLSRFQQPVPSGAGSLRFHGFPALL
jgi:hypothetical protein